MKTTIKLLIGLLVLITGIMSMVNYKLAKQYAAINTADKYYEYEQVTDLTFKNIEVNGGNEVQFVIEKGDKNTLFIHNRFIDEINHQIQNNTLILDFDERLTDEESDAMDHGSHNHSPSVYLTYTDLTEITSTNANIVIQSEMTKDLSINCKGNTQLNLNVSALNGGNLSVEASDKSYVNILENAEKGIISIAQFDMRDTTFLKMKSLKADSISLKMSSESELNCGSSIISKLN